MENGTILRQDRLVYLDTQAPLPFVAGVALAVAVTVTKWTSRRRTRKALKTLPDHMLRDIGLDPHEAWREAVQPFWKE